MGDERTNADMSFYTVRLDEYRDLLQAVVEGGWTDVSGDPTLADAARLIREFYAFREEIWNADEELDCQIEDSVIKDVLAERRKQKEKWGDTHDDEHHPDGELGDAAASMLEGYYVGKKAGWIYELRSKHRQDRRQQLVIGIALGLAELERFDRAAKKG